SIFSLNANVPIKYLALRLFVEVDKTLFKQPSYRQFVALTDNFSPTLGVPEPQVSLEEETRETNVFLTTVLQSKPFQILYQFLHEKGHPYADDPTTFRKMIAQLWFEHYSRSHGPPDTSGFEHVFIGEEKRKKGRRRGGNRGKKYKEINGLHNWLRFYLLERTASEYFDYKGYIDKRGDIMAAVKFTWKGDLKRIGSMLIGTSPEYDMALYTLCFLSRRGREPCKV
ncbi:Endoribonuclease XendoU, partial [Trichostrongylus colubriformis]